MASFISNPNEKKPLSMYNKKVYPFIIRRRTSAVQFIAVVDVYQRITQIKLDQENLLFLSP